MAFTSTVERKNQVLGNLRVNVGTYTSDGGSTGGNINTGLARCDALILQPKGSSVTTNAPSVNETMPGADGSAVTIVTDANEVGAWIAIGR